MLRSVLLACFGELAHVRRSEVATVNAQHVARVAVGRDHDAEPRDHAGHGVLGADQHDDGGKQNAFYRRLARRRAASTHPENEAGRGALCVLAPGDRRQRENDYVPARGARIKGGPSLVVDRAQR